jgi:hypothetical protein
MAKFNTFNPADNGYNSVFKESTKPSTQTSHIQEGNGGAFHFSNGGYSFLVTAKNVQQASEVLTEMSNGTNNSVMKQVYEDAAKQQNGFVGQKLNNGLAVTLKTL